MTIDQLLGLNADEWDKISDEQLEAIFRPMFNVTRPDIAPKHHTRKQELVVQFMSPNKKAAIEALQLDGFDLSFLKKRKRK
jgi:hypothetical protein